MAEGDTTNFVLLAEILTDGGVKLCKYKSNVTGLTVCIAESDGPIVAGYLCVATETHDDDGLPHTLEHMTFLGSESYPYKGILDLIANRCLASGTNAWTDTDHICYTMTTAGDEGFLQLLPIYLDHILYPTLTEHAYITEVHHINGEGEDAGIVYCEMQAKENSGEYRCHLAMLRAMYPGHCGYKSETGGLLKNLRESTSHKKVLDFHKEFFRPENLNIIIVGQINSTNVFKVLRSVEEKILSKGEGKPFVRPWQSPVPPLEDSVELLIDYPCDEDEYGLVGVAWRGPMAKNICDFISLQMFLEYLTDTSVSPLSREFVEIDNPICNSVDYSVIENSVCCAYLHFSNVSTVKLKEVKEKLYKVLNNIADGTEPVDMDRMRTVIRKRKLYILSSMESDPHEQIAASLIGDFLYGSTPEDLESRVCEIPIIEKLYSESPEYWINLLKTYIIGQKYVLVMANPSPELADELSKLEEERIKKQKENLGPDGLAEKAKILKEAVANNELPPPKEMLSCISVPSLKSIKFHPIRRICNAIPKREMEIDFPIETMPCRFQLDDIRTNFVRITVLMDTSHLSQDLRLYLPLFVELLDECAVKRNGEIIPHKEVIKQLADDTICVAALIGQNYRRFFCGSFAQVISFYLMVEQDKYVKSVQWIQDILYHIVFEPKRVKTSIKKLVASISSNKRSAGAITRTMMKNLCFNPESNQWSSSMLRQQTFLSSIQSKLETNPGEVIERLNEVRDKITKSDKLTVHLSLNYEHMKRKIDLDSVWVNNFLPSTETPGMMTGPLKLCYEFLQPFTGDKMKAIITGVGSAESTCLLQCCPTIKSYLHPDYPALLILLQYLTQAEGPMLKKIRGKGLAYSFSIYFDPCQGLIYLYCSKATHPVQAYEEALNVIESHISGKSEWETNLLESAISSLVFDLIDNIKTVDHISDESLAAYYKNVDFSFFETILEKIAHVTSRDMERVGALYLRPLFDPEFSRLAICCNPSKIEDIVEGFKKLSRNLTVVPSLEESFMSEI